MATFLNRFGIGEFVGMISGRFNAVTFRKFLTVLITRRKGKNMQIILDNAKYHHAKLFLSWLEEHKELLFLDFLPAYPQKLNPIERVWKLLKRLRLHNQYFPDLKGVVKIVTKQFLLWRGENTVLRTLCYME